MIVSFKHKLVLYFALLALLPAAAAFYGFDTLAKRSETRRVDARLEAGLRGSLASYAATLADADREARALAGTPELQDALRTRNRRGVALLVAHDQRLAISGRGFAVQGARAGEPTRTVAVVDHGRVIGRVGVTVRVDDRLVRTIRSGLAPGDELVAVRGGRVVAGTRHGARVAVAGGRAARTTIGDTSYRALATAPLADAGGARLVALAPQDAIDASTAATEHRLLIGLVGFVALFALVTYLLGRSIVGALRRLAGAAHAIAGGDLRQRVEVTGRDEFAQLASAFNEMAGELEQRLVELEAERHRLREATARFGEVLAATHDTEQLLRVVVDTIVEATGAYGGVALGPQGELARIGDPEAGLDRLELPLTVGKQSFGRVVIAGPSFDSAQRELANWLISQAVFALENARLHRIVEHQALVDPLTELANRRALEETLHAELARAGRFNGELCLVLCDLDWFKVVNDRFGHPAGDNVLREFAQTLRETVREIDVAGRWGGEEFALILPGTDTVGGAAVAERARVALESREIRSADGEAISVTASFGVAAFPQVPDADALVAAADDALYRAKGAGKNRVETGSGSTTSPITR